MGHCQDSPTRWHAAASARGTGRARAAHPIARRSNPFSRIHPISRFELAMAGDASCAERPGPGSFGTRRSCRLPDRLPEQAHLADPAYQPVRIGDAWGRHRPEIRRPAPLETPHQRAPPGPSTAPSTSAHASRSPVGCVTPLNSPGAAPRPRAGAARRGGHARRRGRRPPGGLARTGPRSGRTAPAAARCRR